MNPRYKPLLLAGGAILAGILVVVVVRGTSGKKVDNGPHTTTSSAPASAEATAPAADANSTAAETFPWDNPGARATAAAPAAPTGTPDDLPLPSLTARSMAQSVAMMKEQVARSSAESDALLQKLNELESAGKIPKDVNVAALRSNLAIAKRAQNLAMEMLTLNQQPASPARDARVQAIIGELQQLQGNIQLDVGRLPYTAPAAPAPAPAPARQ